jgi:hypothetical protein
VDAAGVGSVTRKQALTLCVAVDLGLALVLSIVGYLTGFAWLGFMALLLMVGAVAVLVASRRS